MKFGEKGDFSVFETDRNSIGSVIVGTTFMDIFHDIFILILVIDLDREEAFLGANISDLFQRI